jgi:hypothetical protein
MNIKIILSVILVVVLIGQLDGARPGGRRRNNKKKDQCHLREAENCISKMQELGKKKDPTAIIATKEGLDKICSTIKKDVVECVKAYSKKCGSPLHREILDLVLDQITSRVNTFCKADNPDRVGFLKESPCIHKKVLSTEEYKKTCNNNFLSTVDTIDDELTNKTDDTHASMCCGYVTWSDCTTKMIKAECGEQAIKHYKSFLSGAVGTLSDMACPKDLFKSESEQCVKLRPVPGTKSKGKLGDNAMTKYVTSMFSFLFIIDQK